MNTLEVITRAMRRIGVVAGGELPRDDEAAEALDTLIAIYRRFITLGAFGELTDHIASGPTIACENQRIIRDTLDDTSISLPETISECGRERPPRDCSVVIVTDQLTNQTVEYIYDGSIKNWIELSNLTLTSTAPLADRDPIGLVCFLAVELADSGYGLAPSDITARNAAHFQYGLTHNWSNPQTITPGIFY